MQRGHWIRTAAIVGLTLATAYIHATLGGLLFTLNAAGYVGFGALVVIGATVDRPFVRRFAWLPRVGLIGYAAVTIVGYLVISPYFTLGWIAKGVEVALIAALLVDIVNVYGNPAGLLRAALGSLSFERRTS